MWALPMVVLSPTSSFHPAVRAWFEGAFASPTPAQTQGWREILAGKDTLIAAPTGSGKTLAAFLAGLDALARRADAPEDSVAVLYVSPLKALSSDVQRNLEEPPRRDPRGRRRPHPPRRPRSARRCGPATRPLAARAAQSLRAPSHSPHRPHESLYLMLTADRTRALLRGVTTVIVDRDELHALHAPTSVGATSRCRSRGWTRSPKSLHRSGSSLSATVHPDRGGRGFLVGPGHRLLRSSTSDTAAIFDLGDRGVPTKAISQARAPPTGSGPRSTTALAALMAYMWSATGSSS